MRDFIKSFAVVILSLLRVWFLVIGGLALGLGKFAVWFGGSIVGFADKYAKVIKNLLE